MLTSHVKKSNQLVIQIVAFLVSRAPTLRLCQAYRKLAKCMLGPAEMLVVLKTIRKNNDVLVFGLGNDSPLWQARTSYLKGSVVFLEDDDHWINEVTSCYKYLVVHKVDYATTNRDWRRYVDGEITLPELELPGSVGQGSFDVVLVDGPRGSSDDSPGRIQSITTAPRLAKPESVILVDDFNREAERSLAERYLGDQDFSCRFRKGKIAAFERR